MKIRPIHNDADHRAALVEIDRLWGAEIGTDDGDTLDVLATLVEVYEKDRWPIDRPTPRDMLEYAIDEQGKTQAELAQILGSRSMASELLSGKRKLTLAAAQKISAAWNMPIQLLVAPYETSSAAA